MPKIIVKNMSNLQVKTEGNTTILAALQHSQIDWMHACGAKGRCTTCKAIILKGMNNLNAPNLHEKRFSQLGRLQKNERLGCQAELREGELEIEVPNSSKLPHINYSY